MDYFSVFKCFFARRIPSPVINNKMKTMVGISEPEFGFSACGSAKIS